MWNDPIEEHFDPTCTTARGYLMEYRQETVQERFDGVPALQERYEEVFAQWSDQPDGTVDSAFLFVDVQLWAGPSILP